LISMIAAEWRSARPAEVLMQLRMSARRPLLLPRLAPGGLLIRGSLVRALSVEPSSSQLLNARVSTDSKSLLHPH
jgi:hypothetical protein